MPYPRSHHAPRLREAAPGSLRRSLARGILAQELRGGDRDGAVEDAASEREGPRHVGVHDLGGPIGLHWLASNRARITDLTLLNTLAFPELSWVAKAFMVSAQVPGVRSLLASQWGLETGMKLGVADRSRHTPELRERYTAPFRTADAREALLRTASGLHPTGFETIVGGLEGLEVPVFLLYGEADRALYRAKNEGRNRVRDSRDPAVPRHGSHAAAACVGTG